MYILSADWIVKRRKLLGLSQVSLAAQAGISLPTLQNLEAQKGNPSWDILLKLSKTLGYEIRLVPNPIDWAVLSFIGIPLMQENSVQKPTSTQAQFELKKAISELQENLLNERQKESLLAFLLALHDHYPSYFKKYNYLVSEKYLIQEIKKAKLGRIIKLRRISLSQLKKEFL